MTPSLTDFIKIYKIDIQDDFLDKIKSIEGYFDPALTASGNKDYRKCKHFWMNQAVIDNAGLPVPFAEIYEVLNSSFITALDFYKKDFPRTEQSIIGNHSGAHILKYEEQNYYNLHVDDFGQHAFRRLSISVQLNDNFTGGEFEFFESHKITLKKNECVVFPSSWMYPHRILPVTSGERWSVVTWVI